MRPFLPDPPTQCEGLQIVASCVILKLCGGYIFVESELNKGTELKVYFPSVEEVDEGDGVPGEEKELLKGSETILIVE